jgi:hypothetical protein
MIKTKMIGVTLVSFDQGRKIAKASTASRTPINGLVTANQKETSQSESWAVECVFTLFSQAPFGRHFRKCEGLALRRIADQS